MIAILPHAGEPDGNEDLDREGGANGGDSVAHKKVAQHIESLNREGPIAARRIRLYADALIHLVDAHRDRHGLEEAADECVDALHEIIQAKRGSKK
jgi:hypothetical protein